MGLVRYHVERRAVWSRDDTDRLIRPTWDVDAAVTYVLRVRDAASSASLEAVRNRADDGDDGTRHDDHHSQEAQPTANYVPQVAPTSRSVALSLPGRHRTG